MRPDQMARGNGRTGPAAGADPQFEVAALRARCRHQIRVIDTLREAVSTSNRDASAVRAENADLRAENDRLSSASRITTRADELGNPGAHAEATVPLRVDAPAVAREIVARSVAPHVPPAVLEMALLLVSELVTNSVRHSGARSGDELVVRVGLWNARCRLEVQDPGRHGFVAPPAHASNGAGGTGLDLVESLSEQWGVVRATDGSTRVWAELPCNSELT